MAVWRTRAYDTFGFSAGDYSFSRGKTELFADLVVMAARAGDSGDTDLLDRIADYVCWAASQTADGLLSAVDLAFFLPVIRDRKLYLVVIHRGVRRVHVEGDDSDMLV